MKLRTEIRDAVSLGKQAARANLVPGMALQAIGICLVLSYYFIPSVQDALNALGVFKIQWSPWFAMVSTAVFGAIVPWLALFVFRPKIQRSSPPQLLAQIVFWAGQGWLVDQFYQLQTRLFGDSADVLTVVKKTLVDQLIWGVFIAVPLMTLAYLVIDKNGSPSQIKAALQRKSLIQRLIPVMIGNWTVWIPAITIIYIFPAALQLPLANLVLGFWCLLLLFLSKEENQKTK